MLKLVAAGALVLLFVSSAAGVRAAQEIVISTVADATNGDVSSVASLLVNPGPDGIALREAIEATNNDAGTYTIRFAPTLAGKAITLSFDLPALSGGGVTVEGDIDGNGKPDVTLRPSRMLKKATAFQISSSGNRLHALTLERFTIGVLLAPSGKRLPSHQTFADNVVSGVVLRDIATTGIGISSAYNPDCGLPKPQPCMSYDRWSNTSITGNTIEAGLRAIDFFLWSSTGDRVQGATVTGNSIRLGEGAKPNLVDVAIGFHQGGNSTRTHISNVVIAHNSIEGVNANGIQIGPGDQRAGANTLERLRILDNQMHLVSRGDEFCCQGIIVQAGSDQPELIFPNVHPVRYPDGNIVRNVSVSGNSVSGTLVWGVSVQAGIGAGGSRNRIENVRVERNAIRSKNLADGIYVWEADGEPFNDRFATGNRISGVTIDANRITISKRNPLNFDFGGDEGGIVLLGGGKFGRGNAVRDVRITNNRIAAPQTGIRLIGGADNARGNSVTCVHLAGNRITGTRNDIVTTPNSRGASGNRATLSGC